VPSRLHVSVGQEAMRDPLVRIRSTQTFHSAENSGATEPLTPTADPSQRRTQSTSLRSWKPHRLVSTVFPAKIDNTEPSFGERAIIVAVRATEGDFRDWDEIEMWATEIAGLVREVSER
jgi:hypothetical protein